MAEKRKVSDIDYPEARKKAAVANGVTEEEIDNAVQMTVATRGAVTPSLFFQLPYNIWLYVMDQVGIRGMRSMCRLNRRFAQWCRQGYTTGLKIDDETGIEVNDKGSIYLYFFDKRFGVAERRLAQAQAPAATALQLYILYSLAETSRALGPRLGFQVVMSRKGDPLHHVHIIVPAPKDPYAYVALDRRGVLQLPVDVFKEAVTEYRRQIDRNANPWIVQALPYMQLGFVVEEAYSRIYPLDFAETEIGRRLSEKLSNQKFREYVKNGSNRTQWADGDRIVRLRVIYDHFGELAPVMLYEDGDLRLAEGPDAANWNLGEPLEIVGTDPIPIYPRAKRALPFIDYKALQPIPGGEIENAVQRATEELGLEEGQAMGIINDVIRSRGDEVDPLFFRMPDRLWLFAASQLGVSVIRKLAQLDNGFAEWVDTGYGEGESIYLRFFDRQFGREERRRVQEIAPGEDVPADGLYLAYAIDQLSRQKGIRYLEVTVYDDDRRYRMIMDPATNEVPFPWGIDRERIEAAAQTVKRFDSDPRGWFSVVLALSMLGFRVVNIQSRAISKLFLQSQLLDAVTEIDSYFVRGISRDESDQIALHHDPDFIWRPSLLWMSRKAFLVQGPAADMLRVDPSFYGYPPTTPVRVVSTAPLPDIDTANVFAQIGQQTCAHLLDDQVVTLRCPDEECGQVFCSAECLSDSKHLDKQGQCTTVVGRHFTRRDAVPMLRHDHNHGRLSGVRRRSYFKRTVNGWRPSHYIGDEERIDGFALDYYQSLDARKQAVLVQAGRMEPFDLLRLLDNNTILKELAQRPDFWVAMAEQHFRMDLVADWPGAAQERDMKSAVLGRECDEWRYRYVSVAILTQGERTRNAILYRPDPAVTVELVVAGSPDNREYALLFQTASGEWSGKGELSRNDTLQELLLLVSNGFYWRSRDRRYRPAPQKQREPSYYDALRRYITGGTSQDDEQGGELRYDYVRDRFH